MKPLSNAALSVKSSALKPHKERGRQSSSDLVVRARSVWENVVDNDSEDLLWVGVCCRYHYLVAQSVDHFWTSFKIFHCRPKGHRVKRITRGPTSQALLTLVVN